MKFLNNIAVKLWRSIVEVHLWLAKTSKTGVIINSAWIKSYAMGFNFPLTEDVDRKHLSRGKICVLTHSALIVKLKALYLPVKKLQSPIDEENHWSSHGHLRPNCLPVMVTHWIAMHFNALIAGVASMIHIYRSKIDLGNTHLYNYTDPTDVILRRSSSLFLMCLVIQPPVVPPVLVEAELCLRN